jgi:DNA recombination protein RmuC
LAELNQQISEDAKKLTRALKGEAKTQGNWGEMILESILEKSGLVKGREYFLEHQLTDENNKALYSEFSGKKMRPDAVVKYPDERNVIIDSKVSLTAFTELVDETDAEVYAMKLNQHLSSIKNHINQLSQKAYDDYGKSLDFVMMFIPSEPGCETRDVKTPLKASTLAFFGTIICGAVPYSTIAPYSAVV